VVCLLVECITKWMKYFNAYAELFIKESEAEF